ncbi:MAG: hypothetical protein KAS36_07815 [Anaerolineales bacterium]|nr:hypothetical protein [Anaerolineales bacterium]
MEIEEQLEILEDCREKMVESIYQSCKILIQNGLAEIYGIMPLTELPMIRATELGRAWNESFEQEALQ